MKRALAGLTTFVLVAALGCNSKDLSRSKANDLLSVYVHAHPEECFPMGTDGTMMRPIHLSSSEIQAGEKAGYWKMTQYGWINPSPDGLKVFSPWGQFFNNTFALSKPLPVHVVEVTGISDAEATPGGVKIVDATWSYDLSGLPEDIRKFFSNHSPQPFHGLFKRYDDGWRLEKVVIVADELNAMK